MSGSISKREMLVALAHRVKLNESNWQVKYLMSLVQTAFLFKDNHIFDNLHDLHTFLEIEGILPLEVHKHELNIVIDGLINEKVLTETSSGGWKMNDGKIRDLEKIADDWMKLEEVVKSEWLDYIGSKYQSIIQKEKGLFWRNLIEKFVLKVFLRHGAETIRIIFKQPIPDGQKLMKSVDNMLNESIDGLPETLKEIARIEFLSFFDPGNEPRRRYLMGLLDSALSQIAIALPSEHLKEIYNITSFDLTFILDTNFLFSVLEIHEHHMNESVKEIFMLVDRFLRTSGGKYKIRFRYIPDTLDEFIRTVDSCIIRLEDAKPSIPIARAAIRSEKFIGIDLAYFRKIANSNIDLSPKEFLEPYQKGAEKILKRKGIEVYNDNKLEAIRNSQEVIDDIHNFICRLKRKKRERSWETVQHDVRLWYFVKGLRESIITSSSLLENKYFILTCDYQFLVFDRYYKNKGKFEDQLCILPTQFLQVLSLFVPRTDNFEKAFIHFIRIPMPRAVDAETEAMSLKILKTIASYESFSEDIAVEILTDEALRTEFKKVREPEGIRKLIEDKLSQELEKERDKYDELEKEQKKYREEIARLQLEKEQLSGKEKDLSRKEAEIKKLEANIEQDKKKIEELEKHVEEFHRFKTEAENKEKIKKEKKEKNIVTLLRALEVFGILAVCGLVYLVFLAYLPKISLLTKIGPVGLGFVAYIFFRFRKILSPKFTEFLKWLAIIGGGLNSIKIMWDIIVWLISK